MTAAAARCCTTSQSQIGVANWQGSTEGGGAPAFFPGSPTTVNASPVHEAVFSQFPFARKFSQH